MHKVKPETECPIAGKRIPGPPPSSPETPCPSRKAPTPSRPSSPEAFVYRSPYGLEIHGPTPEEVESWRWRSLHGTPPEGPAGYRPHKKGRLHVASGKVLTPEADARRIEEFKAEVAQVEARLAMKYVAPKRVLWKDMVDEFPDALYVRPPPPGTVGQSIVDLNDKLESLQAMQEDPEYAKSVMDAWPAMGDLDKVAAAEKGRPEPFTMRMPITRGGIPLEPVQVLDWRPHESGASLPPAPNETAPYVFRHANDTDRFGNRRPPKSPFNSFDKGKGWGYLEIAGASKMIVPSMFTGSVAETGQPPVPRPIKSILKKQTKYPDTVYRSVDILHYKTLVSPPRLEDWRMRDQWEEGPMTPRGSKQAYDPETGLPPPEGWDKVVEVEEGPLPESEIPNRALILPYDHKAGRYLTPFDDDYHTNKDLPPLPAASSDNGSLKSNPSFDPQNQIAIGNALTEAWEPMKQTPMPSISLAARKSSITKNLVLKRTMEVRNDPGLRFETEGELSESLSDVWGSVNELSGKEEAMRAGKGVKAEVVQSEKAKGKQVERNVSSATVVEKVVQREDVEEKVVEKVAEKVVESKVIQTTTVKDKVPQRIVSYTPGVFRLSPEYNTVPEPVSFGLSSLPAVSNLAILAADKEEDVPEAPQVRFTFSGEGKKTGMTVEALQSTARQAKSDPRVFDMAVEQVEECLKRLRDDPLVAAPASSKPSSYTLPPPAPAVPASVASPYASPPTAPTLPSVSVSPAPVSSPSSVTLPPMSPAPSLATPAPSPTPAPPVAAKAPGAKAVGTSFQEKKMARLELAMRNVQKLMKERGMTEVPTSMLSQLKPPAGSNTRVTEEDIKKAFTNVFGTSMKLGPLN